MAPSMTSCCLCLTLGWVAATASTLCHQEHGAASEHCLDAQDEAASFLQVSKHATTSGSRSDGVLAADASITSLNSTNKTQGVTNITAVDCDNLNKPLQILKVNDTFGYAIKELNTSSGEYIDKIEIPYDKIPGKFENIGGCGINPMDDIIYCAMFAGGSYVVRVDKITGDVEFVARLPWFKPYNSGDFAPSGVFFVGTWYGEYLAVKDLHKQKGCPPKDKNCKGILDMRKSKRQKPTKFSHSADCVAVTADLEGIGWETYLFVLYAKYLYIARYDNETDTFPKSWKMGVKPSRGDYIYGAGWNFQNQLFYGVNSGKGVYQIPLEVFTKDTLKKAEKGDFTLKLTKIGKSDKAGSNDGLSCMTDPNPWLTQLNSFDCKSYPGPLQAMVNGSGYDLITVDFDTGNTELVYKIPMSFTKPAFKMMNAFSINPWSSVVYACIQLDSWDMDIYPTPPPFYVVRVDEKRVEFVAKVQPPRGSPIAGSFDADGNYYIVSNPTLIKIPFPMTMQGYADYDDEDLPFYDQNSSVIAIAKMPSTSQIADIVAVTADFDGKGNATWVVGVNAYEQLLAVKMMDNETEHYVIPVEEVITKSTGLNDKQNFGAAWYMDGEVFIGSNDGVGVFKVPLDEIEVPDGPMVKLEKVGNSPKIHDNDGLNCIESTSVFWGRNVKFD